MRLDSRTVAQLALPAGKADVIYFDDKLPGFGFRVRASGDGHVRKSWIVQYRHAGSSRRLLLGSAEVLSAAQARELAKEALGKVATGFDPQGEKAARRHSDGHTMRSLADQYLAEKESSLRSRSFAELKRYLATGSYFRPLHNMPLDRITRRDVAARVLAIGRECGATTAARARGSLSSMFAWAMGEGLAESNPVTGTNQPKAPPPRDRVLDDAELAAVWRACGDDEFGRIVRLLILLGQRRTEVGGIADSEIRDGTWTIPSSRSKNHREHILPLPPMALSIIESVPRVVNRDPLFGVRAAGFTSWAQLKTHLDAKLGDQVRPWVLHDLRRSVATRMCDLGVAPHIVEQILNHQSGHRGGVVGVYNRSRYEREVRAAMALWADHVRSIVSGDERKIVSLQQAAS
jgi:integrase